MSKTTEWQDLREFKGVDLTQSFVLSWEFGAGSLLIDVDLFLRPDHPFYERPRPSEQACFRPAHIEFPQCSAVFREQSSKNQTMADTIAQLQGGRIGNLRRTGEGRYEIVGEFGAITLSAERPMVRLKDPTI